MTKQDYFKTFCKLSKAFGSTLETKELLNMVVEGAIKTMQGKAACLFMAAKSQSEFVPVAQQGLSNNYLHAKPTRAKQLVAAIVKEKYLFFRDATSDPRLENHDLKRAEGIASILTVPVMVRGKVIGILSLYTATEREFSEDEIEFLSALAEQGGMAIERARLFERVRNNSRLFLELASNINSSLDVTKILHILTADICEALGLKGVVIRLWDHASDTLKIVASYGLSEEFLNKGPISAHKSMPDVLKGQTVGINDVATDERIQYREEAVQEGIASLLSVPIKAKDEVIGVMNLSWGVKRDFPEDLVILVNALAHQGGLAIQNASLYLKLQQDKKSLEEDIWSHRSWF